MNRIRNIISIFAFSLLLLGLPAIASAQWNGGYGGYGGNGNRRYNQDIRGTVENLKRGAKNFENTLDHGNSSYGRDRNLRSLADSFTAATKNLASSYGRGRNMNNSAGEAQRVLDIASQIDQELSYSGGGGYGRRDSNMMSEWSRMRSDLNVLASTYGYNGNNGRGRINNGSWRNRLPYPF